MNIYKFRYQWVEDDSDEQFVYTELEQPEFEKLLGEATQYVTDTSVDGVNDYLPDAYSRVVDYLEKKGCKVAHYFDTSDEYFLDDTMTTTDGKRLNFYISKRVTKIEWQDLNGVVR